MKQAFVTSDGKTFFDQAQAEAHEKMAKYFPVVKEWAESVYGDKKGMPTRAANVIIRWELDREAVIEKAKEAQTS